MAILKVPDKSTGKLLIIKIDPEDLERLKDYTYMVDQHHSKPFREEKINKLVRRIFLARDVKNFTFGDKKVVSYRNSDIYDCRKENLIEGRTEVKIASGNFWPHTLKSLLNFLDNRKDEEEDLVSSFLAKAKDVKYSRKRINLVFNPIDYQEYIDKKVKIITMRVLHKHFEWGGQVIAAKDLTEDYQLIAPKEHSEELAKPKEKTPFEKTSEKIKIEKEKFDAICSEFSSIDSYRQETINFLNTNKTGLVNILGDVLPLEELIRIVANRLSPNLAMTIHSK